MKKRILKSGSKGLQPIKGARESLDKVHPIQSALLRKLVRPQTEYVLFYSRNLATTVD